MSEMAEIFYIHEEREMRQTSREHNALASAFMTRCRDQGCDRCGERQVEWLAATDLIKELYLGEQKAAREAIHRLGTSRGMAWKCPQCHGWGLFA